MHREKSTSNFRSVIFSVLNTNTGKTYLSFARDQPLCIHSISSIPPGVVGLLSPIMAPVAGSTFWKMATVSWSQFLNSTWPSAKAKLLDPLCQTVMLGADTYYENVVITRTVNIGGEGIGATVVDGGVLSFSDIGFSFSVPRGLKSLSYFIPIFCPEDSETKQ